MGFTITSCDETAGAATGPAYTLADAAGTCRAEVWPFTGFNCLRWQVRTPAGGWGDLLYTAPDWATNPVPTRSGHPVLFPFPNRLRDGHLPFNGTDYRLPRNDSTKANAIHGFTPRVAWRVVGTAATDADARITGQFRLSVDAPASAGLWPADATLNLTYRLTATALRVEAVVENPGPGPLPFGLGYHPYFRLPTAPDATADEMTLWTVAEAQWETDGGLPTGRKLPLPAELDFRTPRPVGPTALDHLFGDVRPKPVAGDGLSCVARLSHPTAGGSLSIHADLAFGELVLFTPAHRKAVAIEPYTCATDAATLAGRGVEAGWRELPPGGAFRAAVEYRWSAAGP